MRVAANKVVSIEYTLKDDDGEVIDCSEEGEPLAYLHGVGTLIPGLEDELEGKSAGDSFQIRLEPEKGYGVRDDSLVQRVSKENFEGIDDLEVGMQFRVDTKLGPRVVTVIEIEEEDVTVDGNHELAGVPLNFSVTVREVRDATPEELDHGHAHGCGCGDHDMDDELEDGEE